MLLLVAALPVNTPVESAPDRPPVPPLSSVADDPEVFKSSNLNAATYSCGSSTKKPCPVASFD